jgi:segregation and condensation protein B
MDQSQIEHIKGAVESLLFVSDKPVTAEQLKEALETVPVQDVREAVKQLQREYRERQCGMVIAEIAGGYQMLSNSIYAEYIRNFYKTRQKEKLSRPALETLAIVAYKQPVTRADIEEIRGVNSDGVMSHLLEKGLIALAGRKEVPGRPYLHATTKQFLEYFGLKSLKDLPKLEDFPALQPAEPGIHSDNPEDPEHGEAMHTEEILADHHTHSAPSIDESLPESQDGEEFEAVVTVTPPDATNEQDDERPEINLRAEIEQTIDEMEAQERGEAVVSAGDWDGEPKDETDGSDKTAG